MPPPAVSRTPSARPVAGPVVSAPALVWMEATRALPFLPAVAAAAQAPSPRAPVPGLGAGLEPVASPRARSSRWAFDAWAQARAGGGPAREESSGAPGVLGGTQAGLQASYRLGAGPLDPRVVMRAVASPAGISAPAQQAAALGVRVRPLRALPVIAQAEVRAVRDGSGPVRAVPAAFVAGGIDDQPLPAGLRLRAFAEAGYAGGEAATGFADGHAVADRTLARLGDARVAAGAGLWGGAQRGAQRLDIGPAATLSLPVGEAGLVRLEASWRVRVAGDAAPGSGPAVTLSTSF